MNPPHSGAVAPGPNTPTPSTPRSRWPLKHSRADTSLLVAIIGLVIAAVSIIPGFRGARLSRDTLDLAQWTALKDYIKACNNKLVSPSSLTPRADHKISTDLYRRQRVCLLQVAKMPSTCHSLHLHMLRSIPPPTFVPFLNADLRTNPTSSLTSRHHK
ncbi:hypothetical protein EDB81DRAFT_60963 [Dactylonectria macrodidyma]|uniref:Uncharacterized protein n=1 Tax=Dactylonectria macrodidyma TaxID=307937 RepID=A0A9P9J484_9HYPO|nr:hypothetical protein EDB81DRAFT_60963 [Dactylonectria macrodidyma]